MDALASDEEAELVEAAEVGQIRAGEARLKGSVGHVEVFRVGQCESFHRPEIPTPTRRRRAGHLRDDGYVLTCEDTAMNPSREKPYTPVDDASHDA
ncbi:hypothetical protein [Actinomadura violacea]|uniref:Uncharacterized protein n=1 Tax=Actinomadura violacea TaxID=2819934 RepID=A0ABS3RQ08_9ACTN|nr:hypothetical protein [Actinomadura violacea]MBO2458155.1 hypothetical protein [Actinomadura violacea]